MEIQEDDNNNNKEIEAFVKSDYININDGEPPWTLEFLKNRESIDV